MKEQVEEIIKKYEYRLESLNGFNPCVTCCEVSVSNAEIFILEEILDDLKNMQ